MLNVTFLFTFLPYLSSFIHLSSLTFLFLTPFPSLLYQIIISCLLPCSPIKVTGGGWRDGVSGWSCVVVWYPPSLPHDPLRLYIVLCLMCNGVVVRNSPLSLPCLSSMSCVALCMCGHLAHCWLTELLALTLPSLLLVCCLPTARVAAGCSHMDGAPQLIFCGYVPTFFCGLCGGGLAFALHTPCFVSRCGSWHSTQTGDMYFVDARGGAW